MGSVGALLRWVCVPRVQEWPITDNHVDKLARGWCLGVAAVWVCTATVQPLYSHHGSAGIPCSH
jgi:hypothetical protein